MSQALKRLYGEEDGQALLYGACVLVLIGTFFYGALDLGQLVLGKINAQSSADSAALSAAALKVSVHNTRSLAYRAMTGQLDLTRLQLIRATGAAISEISTPGKNQTVFEDAIKRAHWHHTKVEELRTGLLAFNAWVSSKSAGSELVQQAAEIGYAGSLGSLASSDQGNVALLDDPQALLENAGRGGAGKMVGHVLYPAEALTPDGMAGYSYVKIQPKVTTLGPASMGMGNTTAMEAMAVAGPIEVPPGNSINARYGINWYSVRLQPVGNVPKGQL
jgi:hypothetical protein